MRRLAGRCASLGGCGLLSRRGNGFTIRLPLDPSGRECSTRKALCGAFFDVPSVSRVYLGKSGVIWRSPTAQQLCLWSDHIRAIRQRCSAVWESTSQLNASAAGHNRQGLYSIGVSQAMSSSSTAGAHRDVGNEVAADLLVLNVEGK